MLKSTLQLEKKPFTARKFATKKKIKLYQYSRIKKIINYHSNKCKLIDHCIFDKERFQRSKSVSVIERLRESKSYREWFSAESWRLYRSTLILVRWWSVSVSGNRRSSPPIVVGYSLSSIRANELSLRLRPIRHAIYNYAIF